MYGAVFPSVYHTPEMHIRLQKMIFMQRADRVSAAIIRFGAALAMLGIDTSEHKHLSKSLFWGGHTSDPPLPACGKGRYAET